MRNIGTSATAGLREEIERLGRRARGTFGLSAVHLQSGSAFALRDDLQFPLASTYKVPIAVVVLAYIDRGDFSQNQMLMIEPREWVAGGPIGTYLRPGEAALSVHSLLELMLIESDNSATDTLMRTVGGPAKITAELRALGIEDITIDRPTSGIIQDGYAISFPSEPNERIAFFRERLLENGNPDPPEAARRYDADRRDQGTPAAMTTILQRLYRRDPHLISEGSVEVLFSIMERCKTGVRRIRGNLPVGTRVYDKTGTFGGTTNDVGIVELPNGAGAFALSVYIRGAQVTMHESESVIAEIARAVFDYYLLVGQ
jgi:beta-lactamase class A